MTEPPGGPARGPADVDDDEDGVMRNMQAWDDVTRMFLMLLVIVGSAILVIVVVVAISDRTSRYERPDWLPRAVEITVTPADTR